jgi:hypothetical protein
MMLMGGTGLWVINQIWKHDYDLGAHDAALLAGWVNGLRVRFEAGDLEAADRYHRSIAWSLRRKELAFECLAEQTWLLAANAGRDCEPSDEAWPIPENWPIPGLENKRLIYNRGESSQSDPSGPGS